MRNYSDHCATLNLACHRNNIKPPDARNSALVLRYYFKQASEKMLMDRIKRSLSIPSRTKYLTRQITSGATNVLATQTRHFTNRAIQIAPFSIKIPLQRTFRRNY